MKLFRILLLVSISLECINASAQEINNPSSVTEVPTKYLSTVSKKISTYSDRISSKAEKTLEKLTKWESKIKNLISKADPAAAEKLFGPGKITFASMLQKVKEGKSLADNYKARYDSYRDKLEVNIKYIESKKDSLDKKYLQPLKKAKEETAEMEKNISLSETAEQMIKERKKELIAEAMKYIGKSKYLMKINKEAYYYAETLKNYKEIFSDPKKIETTALTVLNKIPAFAGFMRKNSMLASLFGGQLPPSGGGGALAGLQTRTQVNSLIQNRIAQGGPNAAARVSQNIQQGRAQLQQLKDKVIKAGGGNSDAEAWDSSPLGRQGGVPNKQKTKTFMQRLELGSNFQFGKPHRFAKSTADIALSAGYKLNDKSIVGIGIAYKMGYGEIRHLSISHEGLGLRSFMDYKLKKNFFLSGGYEMNYTASFKDLRSLQSINDWQQSGLIGISKKIKIKTKFIKGTKFQLLYDFLYKTHVVASPAILFRVGYDFK